MGLGATLEVPCVQLQLRNSGFRAWGLGFCDIVGCRTQNCCDDVMILFSAFGVWDWGFRVFRVLGFRV